MVFCASLNLCFGLFVLFFAVIITLGCCSCWFDYFAMSPETGTYTDKRETWLNLGMKPRLLVQDRFNTITDKFPVPSRILKRTTTRNKQVTKLSNIWTYLKLTTFILISEFHIIQSVEGSHWIPKQHEMVHHVHVHSGIVNHESNPSSFTQPLRFKVSYDGSIRVLQKLQRELVVKRLMPEAVSYFSKTFHVRPAAHSIKLQRMCENNSYFLKSADGTELGDVAFCKHACVKTTCGPVTVPNMHLDQCRVCDSDGIFCKNETEGLNSGGMGLSNADFVLYVSAIQTRHCVLSKAIAYASYCQQEHLLDRPIAGFANICPLRLETDPRHYYNILATIKHEIFHALGFSAGLYAFFRDEYGQPLSARGKHGLPVYNQRYHLYEWSNRVVRNVVRKNWSTRYGDMKHITRMLVTPRVVQEVRRHFNCMQLEGAEIENQGGTGTELTHWEKRLFENEAMTGTYTQNPVFSRLSLALMEDTGWYKANYEKAENLDWGKGLGCYFAKGSCKTWMERSVSKGTSAEPYCYQVKQLPLRMHCTHSKFSLALCNLRRYSSPLPKEYQYFNHLPNARPGSVIRDTAYFGGAVAIADYCPYYQKFALKSATGRRRETECNVAENMPSSEENFALEFYGRNSKCFLQGRQWTAKKGLLTRTMLDWGSGCYQYSCGRSGLQVKVGDRTYSCHNKGQNVEVFGILGSWIINGSLSCPACSEFCNTQTCKSRTFQKVQASHSPGSINKMFKSSASSRYSLKEFIVLLITALLVVTANQSSST